MPLFEVRPIPWEVEARVWSAITASADPQLVAPAESVDRVVLRLSREATRALSSSAAPTPTPPRGREGNAVQFPWREIPVAVQEDLCPSAHASRGQLGVTAVSVAPSRTSLGSDVFGVACKTRKRAALIARKIRPRAGVRVVTMQFFTTGTDTEGQQRTRYPCRSLLQTGVRTLTDHLRKPRGRCIVAHLTLQAEPSHAVRTTSLSCFLTCGDSHRIVF